MEELFLDTGNVKIPIPQNLIEKYHLKKGIFSPFSNFPIVDQHGEFGSGYVANQNKPVLDPDEDPGTGLVQMENGILLSTSEMIDLSQGADSDSGMDSDHE